MEEERENATLLMAREKKYSRKEKHNWQVKITFTLRVSAETSEEHLI